MSYGVFNRNARRKSETIGSLRDIDNLETLLSEMPMLIQLPARSAYSPQNSQSRQSGHTAPVYNPTPQLATMHTIGLQSQSEDSLQSQTQRVIEELREKLQERTKELQKKREELGASEEGITDLDSDELLASAKGGILLQLKECKKELKQVNDTGWNLFKKASNWWHGTSAAAEESVDAYRTIAADHIAKIQELKQAVDEAKANLQSAEEADAKRRQSYASARFLYNRGEREKS